MPDYIDMTAEEIYQQFETRLNHTFVNVDSDVKSYDFGDNIFATSFMGLWKNKENLFNLIFIYVHTLTLWEK